MVTSLDADTPEFGRLSPPRPAWLASAVEEPAVDSEIALVDTHFHVWENGSYSVEDYVADCEGQRVIASVYVECGNWYRTAGPEALKPVGETEAVVRLAREHAGTLRLGAIVPRVDLCGSSVQAAIEAHLEAGGSLIGAVRDGGAYDADPTVGNAFFVEAPGRYRSEAFADGMSRLARHGLPFEAWAFFTQLDDVYALALRFPDTTIVLEHCGGPLGYGPYAGRRDEVYAAWERAMVRLSACDNVVVKLGGLMIRLAAFDYRASSRPATSTELSVVWSRYIGRVLELFGAERCMAESNYPVERAGASFAAVVNALKRSAAHASHSEREAIFSTTAQTVYRIEPGDQVLSDGPTAADGSEK